jgi:hypothetical protein
MSKISSEFCPKDRSALCDENPKKMTAAQTASSMSDGLSSDKLTTVKNIFLTIHTVSRLKQDKQRLLDNILENSL